MNKWPKKNLIILNILNIKSQNSQKYLKHNLSVKKQ